MWPQGRSMSKSRRCVVRRARHREIFSRIDRIEKAPEHLLRGASLLIGHQQKMADQNIVRAAKANRDDANAAVSAALTMH